MTALGDFIRHRRRELSLTQASLAIRMGVDATYVSAVERGRRRPEGASFLEVVARALELPPGQVENLVAVAQQSQRALRIPEELSLIKHTVLRAIVHDLPHFTDADMEIFAAVHAALARNRAPA